MIKQCGTCEFWDRENAVAVFPSGRRCAPCNVPIPMWAEPDNQQTWEDVGQDCQVYKERQDSKNVE